MSCSPDAPYKSRLFNFLNRQSQQWRDRGLKAARSLQVGLVWGLQILAYPVYLLVQSGRWTGRQLAQKASHVRKQLLAAGAPETVEESEEISVDTPIQRVLAAVKPWLALPQGNAESILLPTQATSSIVQPEKIRGIACLCEPRSLVLVTVDNVSLDVLSPQQQEQLQQRLILELADLRYRQHQQLAAAQPLRFSAPQEEDSPVIAPVRWFWGLMRWVQCSPVAIAIDLFQEATLVAVPAPQPPLPPVEFAAPHFSLERLAQLDDRLAKLEAQAESLTVTYTLGKLRQHLATLAKPLQEKLHHHEQPSDPTSLQELIYAALDYFFGDNGKEVKVSGATGENPAIANTAEPSLGRLLGRKMAGVLPQSPDPLHESLSTHPGDPEFSEDLWLSWADLYGEDNTASTPTSKLSKIPLQLTNAAQPPVLRSPLTVEAPGQLATANPASAAPQPIQKPGFWQKVFPPRQARPPQALAVSAATDLASASPSSSEVAPTSASQPHSLDPAFEWLETEATSIGYVKHPLEQILEWLDGIMVWLENVVVAIWEWLYRRIP
jgi:molybdopterin converting factor small subunit